MVVSWDDKGEVAGEVSREQEMQSLAGHCKGVGLYRKGLGKNRQRVGGWRHVRSLLAS